MNSTPVRNLQVLLVEDDPGDLILLREALGHQPLTELLVAQDGQAALDLLHAHVPDLVVLDLWLPEVDGFGVLKWLREQPSHAHIPVVVLTSAASEEDKARTYALDATTFLTKPADPQDLIRVVRAINDFWLRSVVARPSREATATRGQ